MVQEQLASLPEEMKAHQAHVEGVKARLERSKGWLEALEKEHKQHVVGQLLQHCILPRAVASPEDALFCSHFTHLLHSMATPNFASLAYYDKACAPTHLSMSLCAVKERKANSIMR